MILGKFFNENLEVLKDSSYIVLFKKKIQTNAIRDNKKTQKIMYLNFKKPKTSTITGIEKKIKKERETMSFFKKKTKNNCRQWG